MNDTQRPDESPEHEPDRQPDADDPTLTEYDKTLADSFPSSDPPAMP